MSTAMYPTSRPRQRQSVERRKLQMTAADRERARVMVVIAQAKGYLPDWGHTQDAAHAWWVEVECTQKQLVALKRATTRAYNGLLKMMGK